MVCDCAMPTPEEMKGGMLPCGDDCLNRLLMIEWSVTSNVALAHCDHRNIDYSTDVKVRRIRSASIIRGCLVRVACRGIKSSRRVSVVRDVRVEMPAPTRGSPRCNPFSSFTWLKNGLEMLRYIYSMYKRHIIYIYNCDFLFVCLSVCLSDAPYSPDRTT